MAQGRCSAKVATGLLLLYLLVNIESVYAATYTVGDSGGWTFNVAAWPRGKRFRAGDTLVFKYGPAAHNVVTVNKVGYSACTTPSGARVFQSGRDQVKLVKGQNFFICNFPGHCESGMKIAVTAL